MLFSLIVYLLLAALLLVGLRRRPAGESGFPTGDANALRGFFALIILLGHCARESGGGLLPLGKFMIVAVAFYFFVSGYGLARSYARQPATYLQGFLWRKVSGLLVLAVTAYLWRVALSLLTGPWLPHTIFQYNFFTATNWYIWCQIYYYIAFFLVYRYLSRHRTAALALLVLAQCLVCYAAGLQMAWYASAVGFPLGVLFWEQAARVDALLRRGAGLALIVGLLAAGLVSQLYTPGNLLDLFLLRNALCAALLLALYRILCKFIPGNPALQFLGQYSGELYLFQFTYLDLFADLPVYPWRFFCVMAATLATAVVVHPLILRLRRWLTPKGA